jgi:N-acetylmuramoyl-L-alanine amidase
VSANLLRMRRTAPLALALLAALAFAVSAQAGPAPRIHVYFVRGGELAAVERRASSIPAAVRALLAGPTAGERKRGLRSALPAGTRLRGVAVERRIVTVDLDARVAAGRDDGELRRRAGQIVRTVGSLPGVRAVRLLVEGGTPIGLFPGYDLRRAVTPAAVRPAARAGVRELQSLLRDLGFLPPGGVTGVHDARSAVAVIAFQKWAGLPRDGVLGPATVRALARATRPSPVGSAPGRRVQILLDRQLALLVDGGKVLRAVHVSTGAYGRTPTGSYRVYRKERYSWSVPFSVWMPWASYFTGGIAMHEYPVVPTYPASHGCIRISRYDAPAVYAFAEHGTAVEVLAHSA